MNKEYGFGNAIRLPRAPFHLDRLRVPVSRSIWHRCSYSAFLPITLHIPRTGAK
jgi:hypothetical protein